MSSPWCGGVVCIYLEPWHVQSMLQQLPLGYLCTILGTEAYSFLLIWWCSTMTTWQTAEQDIQRKSWWEKGHKGNLILHSKENLRGPNGNAGGGWISWWQSNAPMVDDYDGCPEQVVHDHWNPNETGISLSWSEVIKLLLEYHAVVLGNCRWGCNGHSMMSWSSPWSNDSSWKTAEQDMPDETDKFSKSWFYLGNKPLTKGFQDSNPGLESFGNQTLSFHLGGPETPSATSPDSYPW